MTSARYTTVRKTWLFIALVPVVICILPFIFILTSALQTTSDEVKESFVFFSVDSVNNTFTVAGGVLFLSFVFGVGFAYLFSHYRFTGSRIFETLFILPIAIPGYIMAVTYASFFDYGGLFFQSTGTYFNMMNMWGLIFVLSLCLYPYIFIAALNAFKLTSGNYEETGKLMGLSPVKRFLKIGLPLSLPAIIGGCWLVLMETLNDFGAASYFGIRTVSTEIFRCWQIGPSVSVLLSLIILVLIVLGMLCMQRYLNKREYYQAAKPKPFVKEKLSGGKNILAALSSVLFFCVSFGLPVFTLCMYTAQSGVGENARTLTIRTINSFSIAATAAGLILLLCVFAGYNKVVNAKSRTRFAGFFTDFGYAVPGAALAVALIGLSTSFDATFNTIITGTFFFLIIAYMVRFYTVARQPVENLYRKIPVNLYNAGLNLGKSPLQNFIRIYLPVMLPAFISVFLIVFIDVLKELPLTLILSPFNFETLATSVYDYAKLNESVQEAAPYALLIITLGVVAVLLFKRIERKYGSTQA